MPSFFPQNQSTYLFSFFFIVISMSIFAQTNPPAWDLKSGDYFFTNYQGNSNSTIYPPSMQGWQGPPSKLSAQASETAQPTGDEPLCGNCADALGSINNEGLDGISIKGGTATTGGNGKSLVLAINTTDCFDIHVSWIGRVIDPGNVAVQSGIQLQYRVGSTGNWTNTDQFFSSAKGSGMVLDGDFYPFTGVLPDDANDQPLVQLRWIYFVHTATTANAHRYSVSKIWASAGQITGEPAGYCRAMGNADCSPLSHPGASTTPYDRAYIDDVQLISAPLALNWVNNFCPLSQGYSDYTNINVNLQLGLTYPVRIEVGRNAAVVTTVLATWYVTIFIDWNQDLDFDDPDETIPLQQGYLSRIFTGNVSVPPTAKSGKTRMRIRSTFIPGVGPCGPTPDGEVEDYTLVINNPVVPEIPDCAQSPVPVDGSTNLCQDQDSLKWTPSSSGDVPTGYNLFLGTDNPPTNIENGTDVGNNTGYAFASPLAANTTYYWQAVPYDADGSPSGCPIWSFTTVSVPTVDVQYAGATPPNDTITSCVGQVLTAHAAVSGGTAPLTYNWSGNNMGYVTSTTDRDSIDHASTSVDTVQYTVVVSDANGCASADSVAVINFAVPVPGTITGPLSTCEGVPVTLNLGGSDATEFQWQQQTAGGGWQNIAGATTVSHTIGSPNQTAAYRVQVRKNSCEAFSPPFNLTVNPRPASPQISSSNGSVFCDGNSTWLRSSNNSGNNWSTGSTMDSIWVDQTGTYQLTYTDGNGCVSVPATYTVNVNPNPAAPVISSSIGNTFCEYESTWLVSSQPENNQWSTGSINDSIHVSATGTYSTVYTDANGCSSPPASYTVTVNAAPPIPNIFSQNGASGFCEGDSIILKTDATDPIRWNGNPALVGTELTVATPGHYFVKATNTEGCSSQSFAFTVEEYPYPEAPEITSSTGNFLLCDGSTLLLTATGNGSITWNNDPTYTGSQFLVLNKGSYSARVTSPFGCSTKSKVVKIESIGSPQKPVIQSATGLNQFCTGESLTLFTDVPDYLQIRWNGDGNDASPIFETDSSGWYYVEVTNSVGCTTQSDYFIVNEFPSPPIPSLISASGDLSFCAGQSLTLQTDAINGSVYWNNDTVPGQNWRVINKPGIYTVTVTNGFNCTSQSDELLINELPAPEKPAIVQNNKDLMIVNIDPVNQYQWYQSPNIPVAGATNEVFSPLSDGIYFVLVTNPEGCTSRSENLSYFINGIASHDPQAFVIAPNPVQAGQLISVVNGKNITKMALLNVLGQVVIQSSGSHLSTRNIAPGTYMLYIWHNNDASVPAGKVVVR